MWEPSSCFTLRYTIGPLSLITFFSFWVSPIFSCQVLRCPILDRPLRQKRNSRRSRGAARGRAPQAATNIASPTNPRRERSTQFTREETWFWTRTSNLTLPPKGHMTGACVLDPRSFLIADWLFTWLQAVAMFLPEVDQLYPSAEACHNLAVHL